MDFSLAESVVFMNFVGLERRYTLRPRLDLKLNLKLLSCFLKYFYITLMKD